MNTYSADLHIHTVLSPCGDLEMSPINIIEKAKEKKIDIIGITDHNSTKQCALIKKIGEQENVFVLCGAEVTTKEEVHCLAFFENIEKLNQFQYYLEQHIMVVKNNPEKFGHQVVVDEQENIIEEVENLLISALDQTIDELEQVVHRLEGIFIPAHVDKAKNSIISQLGFIPTDLKVNALELSKHQKKDLFLSKQPLLKSYCFIQSSDAHYIDDLGTVQTKFVMKDLSFNEIKLALANKDGRKVIVK